MCQLEEAKYIKIVFCRSEVNAAKCCVTNQTLQLSGRLSADQRPRLPTKVSARRGQDCQDCVHQSKINAARDCVTNPMLRLSGLLFANQRSRLQDIVSPIRGQGFQGYCSPIKGPGCKKLCRKSEAKDFRDTVCQSDVKAARDFVINQMRDCPPIRGLSCPKGADLHPPFLYAREGR
jgi:hypothetical protein